MKSLPEHVMAYAEERPILTVAFLYPGTYGAVKQALSRLDRSALGGSVEGRASTDEGRAVLAQEVDREAAEAAPGIDIDEAADTTFALTDRPASSVTMDDVDRVIRRPKLLPDGFTVQPLGPREYSLTVQGRESVIRITTDADYFERHADSVELWSPGRGWFSGRLARCIGASAVAQGHDPERDSE